MNRDNVEEIEMLLSKSNQEIYALQTENRKLIDISIRACDIIHWISSFPEDPIKSVSESHYELMIVQLSKLGIEKFGTIGETINDYWGWFDIESYRNFTVVVPAWVLRKDGEIHLWKKGVGI